MSTTIVLSCPPIPVHVSTSSVQLHITLTMVRIRMSTAPWLDFQLVVKRTFDYVSDLLGGFWVGNCRRSDCDAEIVRLDVQQLKEGSALEREQVLVSSKSTFQALLHC
jgi:hypothetical protein